MDFDQTWYILRPYESGTLLIFKVKGPVHREKFVGHALRVLPLFLLTKDVEKVITRHSYLTHIITTFYGKKNVCFR